MDDLFCVNVELEKFTWIKMYSKIAVYYSYITIG